MPCEVIVTFHNNFSGFSVLNRDALDIAMTLGISDVKFTKGRRSITVKPGSFTVSVGWPDAKSTYNSLVSKTQIYTEHEKIDCCEFMQRVLKVICGNRPVGVFVTRDYNIEVIPSDILSNEKLGRFCSMSAHTTYKGVAIAVDVDKHADEMRIASPDADILNEVVQNYHKDISAKIGIDITSGMGFHTFFGVTGSSLHELVSHCKSKKDISEYLDKISSTEFEPRDYYAFIKGDNISVVSVDFDDNYISIVDDDGRLLNARLGISIIDNLLKQIDNK